MYHARTFTYMYNCPSIWYIVHNGVDQNSETKTCIQSVSRRNIDT